MKAISQVGYESGPKFERSSEVFKGRVCSKYNFKIWAIRYISKCAWFHFCKYMRKTAVCFDAKPRCTVYTKAARTVPIWCSKSSNWRLTAFVLLSGRQNKIPFFLTFKETLGGPIERNLLNCLPEDVFKCFQMKCWAGKSSLDIWAGKIWKFYVAQYDSTILILDVFACHTEFCYVNSLREMGTDTELIYVGCTCILQQNNVGVTRSLKCETRKEYIGWARNTCINLQSQSSRPIPDRKGILEWSLKSFNCISADSVQNTFQHIGYSPSVIPPPQTPCPFTTFLNWDSSDWDRIDDNNMVGLG